MIFGGGGRVLLFFKNLRFMLLKLFLFLCCYFIGDCCFGDKLEFDDWLVVGEWLSGELLLILLLVLDSVVFFLLRILKLRMGLYLVVVLLFLFF